MIELEPKIKAPDGFERVKHHDNLTLHNKEKGVIIDVIERDEIDRMVGKWPFKVVGAKNQKTIYDGVFDSQSHAEMKAVELAKKHSE